MNGTLAEQAAGRVAAGTAGSIEAAVWSITYQTGYVHGRRDGESGTSRGIEGATEGYAAGYARGYRWGVAHPVAAFSVTFYAGPTITVQAETADEAFTRAQTIARTTGTGVVRDESGRLV